MIGTEGPMPLAQYMGLANAHYYATRDPLGAAGDFTTAPEISQMFGELIGLVLADVWDRAGRPTAHYVELGPGRGTLAVDAVRAMARAGLRPAVHLVETSPVLRAAQSARLTHATHHEAIDTLPGDTPLLIVANEFFDALPVRQLVRGAEGWREREVRWDGTRFGPMLGRQRFDPAIPPALRDAPEGSVVETSPASVATMRALAERLAMRGGVLLAIDYGYVGPLVGDSVQAVAAHRFADPYEAPGTRDLTAHVDFAALAETARQGGCTTAGPVPQGRWLTALGIAARAAALARTAPDRAAEIETARTRLVEEAQMGTLFKVLAVAAPGWPMPAGLA